jgi:hypothetical protein
MRPVLFLVPILAIGCDEPSEEDLFFEPAALYVEGGFGYDAATENAVAYTVEGDPVNPSIALVAVRDEWFDSFDDADRCTVVLEHDPTNGDLPAAPWVDEVSDDGVWFGFTMPDTATVTTDCTEWDPDVWGDPGTALATWTWGLGIAAFDADVEEELEDAVTAQYGEGAWEDSWEPVVFGGGFYWSGAEDQFPGGFLNNDYAFAATVDASFALVIDANGNTTSVPATDVVDGTLPSGAYAVRYWYGLDADLVQPTNL